VACALAISSALGCATGGGGKSAAPPTLGERLADAAQRLSHGRRDEAFHVLRDLSGELEARLKQAPRRADLRVSLGIARHLLGDDGAALQQFEAAASDPGEAAVASYNAGQVRQLRWEYGAALEWFKRAEQTNPGDWRSAAKLVQVYQALGRTWDRDRERQKLFGLYQAGKVHSVEYCREQIQTGRSVVLAYEQLDLSGEWPQRYRFVVADASAPGFRRVFSFGSNQETTWLAQLHGMVGSRQRLFHLDSYGPSGEHQTFAFFTSEPSYEELKERVLQALQGTSRPLSGFIPGVCGPSPRVMPAALQIDRHAEESYVQRTFLELLELSKNISMNGLDPERRVSVVQLANDPDVGTMLLAKLANSPRTVTIFAIARGNKTTPKVAADAQNGKGTDAAVYFNPDYDPAIPTVTAGDRVIDQRGRPAYIGLGHELIHALHYVTGTMAGPQEFQPCSYRNQSGDLVTVGDEDLEELNTVGLCGHRNGPTENELRQVHQVARRGAYRSYPESENAP
jgi:tetratricopeptide (TPR) repeat protein